MLTFKHFKLSAPDEWDFARTDPIVIGKHRTNGSLLQISPAFKNDISDNPGHSEAILALKEFAQLNDADDVEAEIVRNGEVKIGFFPVYKENGTEIYFYAINNYLLTVAVLQRSQQSSFVKDQVISILESVTYESA